MKNKKSRFIFFSTVFCVFIQCSKTHETMGPEEVLKTYLEIAFNINDTNQRSLLIPLTRGNLRRVLEEASTSELEEAYVKPHYRVDHFSVLYTNPKTPREVEMTYQVTYQRLNSSQSYGEEAIIHNENTVAAMRIDGRWYLHDLLTSHTELDFTSVRTSSIGLK